MRNAGSSNLAAQLPPFTRVGRPDPTLHRGALIFNTDDNQVQVSDGFDWNATGLDVIRGAGSRREIFFDDTGSDITGDGTSANPYLTPERAIQDMPQFVLLTASAVCRVKTSSTRTLPAKWVWPFMQGDGSVSAPTTPVDPAFPVEQNFNFLAPYDHSQDILIPANHIINTTVQDKTGFVTYFIDPNHNPPYTPFPNTGDRLKGKVAIDANGALATVEENSQWDITFTARAGEFVAPFTILEQSSTVALNDIGAAIEVGSNCSNIQIGGFKITNTGGNSYPSAGALHLIGARDIHVVGNDVRGQAWRQTQRCTAYANGNGTRPNPGANDTNWTVDGQDPWIYRNYINHVAFDQFFVPGYSVWQSSFNGADRIGHTEGPGSSGSFAIVQSHFQSGTLSAIAYYGGPQSFVHDCLIDDSIHNGILGFGNGQLQVRNTKFVNHGYADIQMTNGCQCEIDDQTTGTYGLSADNAYVIAPPTGVVVTPVGADDGALWSYFVVALRTTGSRTLSLRAATVHGALIIGGGNKNTITWTDPADGNLLSVVVFRIFGPSGAGTGIIGTVAPGTQTFDDTGQASDGASNPSNIISFADFRDLTLGNFNLVDLSTRTGFSRIWQNTAGQ